MVVIVRNRECNSMPIVIETARTHPELSTDTDFYKGSKGETFCAEIHKSVAQHATRRGKMNTE